MASNGIFIAFNLIDRESRATLFDYPIIYWWDTTGALEEMFKDKSFLSKLKEKLSKESFYNIDAMVSYVSENEDGEFIPTNLKKPLNKLIEFPKEFEDDLISDVLKYLYKCSFKEEPKTNDIKELFANVKSKYPKKVTSEVVMRYIETSISESYPNIPQKEIDKLLKKFLETIL